VIALLSQRNGWGRRSGVGRRAGLIALCASALLLGACEDFGFFKRKDPLPGERIAVMMTGRSVEPDLRIADLPVRLPRPVANAEWPQAGGLPAHAMHHLAVGDTLRIVWRADIGRGSSADNYHLLGAPVVAAGKVFAIDTRARVTAVDATSGAVVWSVDTAPESGGQPVASGGVSYDDGRVFVATAFAQVVALDAATGEQSWRQPTNAPLRAAPTVSGGRVFATTVDNQTFAFDAQDGRRIWTHSGISEIAGLLGGASPAVDAGTVVVPYTSGELFALRAENGRVVWSDSLIAVRRIDSVSNLADIRGRPVIDRGLVIAISHSGRMAAIDLRSGNRIWDRDIGGTEMPWVAGDFVYVLTNDNQLVCLTRRDGRVRWATGLSQYQNPDKKQDRIFWSGPVLVSDRLVLVNSVGEALAVSPYTGDPLGRMALPRGTFIAPVVAGETMFILTENAQLLALR